MCMIVWISSRNFCRLWVLPLNLGAALSYEEGSSASAAESAVACCSGVNADIVLIGEKRIELSVDRVFEVRVETSVVSGGKVVVKLLGSSEVSVRSSS